MLVWTRSCSTWANFMLKSLRDPDNSAMYKYHFAAGWKLQDSIVVTSRKLCLDSLQQIVVKVADKSVSYYTLHSFVAFVLPVQSKAFLFVQLRK